MNCPSRIIITVENIRNQTKIQNLVCYVEILTNTKNSYTLGPFLTNQISEFIKVSLPLYAKAM
jgi:hypothetical protein